MVAKEGAMNKECIGGDKKIQSVNFKLKAFAWTVAIRKAFTVKCKAFTLSYEKCKDFTLILKALRFERNQSCENFLIDVLTLSNIF